MWNPTKEANREPEFDTNLKWLAWEKAARKQQKVRKQIRIDQFIQQPDPIISHRFFPRWFFLH